MMPGPQKILGEADHAKAELLSVRDLQIECHIRAIAYLASGTVSQFDERATPFRSRNLDDPRFHTLREAVGVIDRAVIEWQALCPPVGFPRPKCLERSSRGKESCLPNRWRKTDRVSRDFRRVERTSTTRCRPCHWPSSSGDWHCKPVRPRDVGR